MKEILEKILADPRYQRNIEYGEPRSGHPEGRIKFHIADLENNLERLSARGISSFDYWKLKFLIHVHDTFKGEVDRASPFSSRHHHELLAREYASQFTNDDDLLNMLQYHDVNYSLWKQFTQTGSYDMQQFQNLLDTIHDWDLFLMFIIIDGCSKGKDPLKTGWFINEVKKHKATLVDESWLLQFSVE
ncbi:MAG: hypothetical protein HOP27_04100 [Anaerolineales bacterium]|nr:hypothetical protein [Anaerolineales bacterium]